MKLLSQSPDGDFFDPDKWIVSESFWRRYSSQSPDGDFFDPDRTVESSVASPNRSHSPLTGIFLIRRSKNFLVTAYYTESQSPDGDFFDPESST